MGLGDYIWLGLLAVFQSDPLFHVLGVPVAITPVMVATGFLVGIVVGATPGMAGPVAMAIALPILISAFGYTASALLPVMGCLVGIMKGATVGGAVPAILFNTPGTPDAYMTTLDGYPMAQAGRTEQALRVAHFSSASGDTLSDVVLVLCAPFLAILVERYLDLPEKTALLILSLSFIAAVVGRSPAKGLISLGLGLLAAYIGTGEDFYPRLSFGTQALSDGFPISAAVLGVLVIGAVLHEMLDLKPGTTLSVPRPDQSGTRRLHRADLRRIMPYVGRSAVIGTVIGALPGVGSTLAATLGYTMGANRRKRVAPDAPQFGDGIPEGVAATEAANSSVSGANLIPVLSLGIPGNAAAVFLILATDTIGGFNPGPGVFRMPDEGVNPELVVAFGLFASMFFANILNWCVGGHVMRAMGVMTRVPRAILLPSVLLMTLSAIYAQETRLEIVWFALGFGILGVLLRNFGISPLPFVIAFILGGRLEDSARQAFAATGGDVFFLFTHPVAAVFMALSVTVIWYFSRSGETRP